MASYTNEGQVIINLPSGSNQDRGSTWKIGSLQIDAVADGHSCNGHKVADKIIKVLDDTIYTIDWTTCDLTDIFNQLFKKINEDCKQLVGKGCSLDTFMGGSTLTIGVNRNDDYWIAHVGDSEAVLFESDGSYQILTSDHEPSNIEEAQRMVDMHPKILPFIEYDRVRKVYPNGTPVPINPLYDVVDKKLVKRDPPEIDRVFTPASVNYYVKNVDGEHAIYIGYDERNKLAMTRSIGDYKFQERMGLICEPSISRIDKLTEGQQIIIASDGLWDCWKKSEIAEFLQENDASLLEKKHVEKSTELFGSNKDDTFCIVVEGSGKKVSRKKQHR